MTDVYIHRTLLTDSGSVSEEELLTRSGIFVVLGEPGSGKSELLEHLSAALGVKRKLASIFRHEPPTRSSALVIDGVDEVARLDEAATDAMLVKARECSASTVILACRSYVWDDARTHFLRESFGAEVTVLRLQPFDFKERQHLFTSRYPDEDFRDFVSEVDRVDLTQIIGNPQFLLLLTEAYLESGRRFTTKAHIYIDAVRRLATERKDAAAQRKRPPIDSIVAIASEVFAMLLLSGSVGVSSVDGADAGFPYLLSLSRSESDTLFRVLDTRLFKPSTQTACHEPIHRIVAEYCAARHLVSRIDDPTDFLSLRRCLAIIAPNAVPRGELRGLMGWMATLGSPSVQQAVIDVDPYAVLVNGDPSQLGAAAKRRLVWKLRELSSNDPYFRRADAGRLSSLSEFFTADLAGDVSVALAAGDGSHLQGLLLELLCGSPAAAAMADDLTRILLDHASDEGTRLLACRCLDQISDRDHASAFDVLVQQGTSVSLRLASEAIMSRRCDAIRDDRLLLWLKAVSCLYPAKEASRRSLPPRYFVQRTIETFTPDLVRTCMDALAADLPCSCGGSGDGCRCGAGTSELMGHLLDRYFDTFVGPHDPGRLHAWTKDLLFRKGVSAHESIAVHALKENHGLRRAVQTLASEQSVLHPDSARLLRARARKHSGLDLSGEDLGMLVEHAFATSNIDLWETLFPYHDLWSSAKGAHPLRSVARGHASRDPRFRASWARLERKFWKAVRHGRRSRVGLSRRRRWETTDSKEVLRNDLAADRDRIERGEDWIWLKRFALAYLHEADSLDGIAGADELAHDALKRCIPFLTPHVPTLGDLSVGIGGAVAEVLHAACLAIFRDAASLKALPIDLLRAVKTDSGGARRYREGESDLFEAELDRLLFGSEADLIAFATSYIEPQLRRADDEATQAGFLTYKAAFHPVRGALALDWLRRYPAMPWSARDTLFEIAAQFGDRAALNALVRDGCEAPKPLQDGGPTGKRREFWLIRDFFFSPVVDEEAWRDLSADPKSIFMIEHRAGVFQHVDNAAWPRLTAEKVYRVLDSYVDHWRKVPLPNSFGSSDPPDEIAYRFLSDVLFQIRRDDPALSIVVLDRLLRDDRFIAFSNNLKSERAFCLRQAAHSDFEPPKPRDVVGLFHKNRIASVEDLRALLLEMLDELQGWLKGAATDPLDMFYDGVRRVDENTARSRIFEKLEDRLKAMELIVVIEHHMAQSNRCDATISTLVDNRAVVLVTEVKGQWHPELFSAASLQLAARYMIYPGAAQQGVYLVLWFGDDEKIAGRADPAVKTPIQLRETIVSSMPAELRGAVDVFVLDLSRPDGRGRGRSVSPPNRK